MAGETSQPRRSRPMNATPGDAAARQPAPEPDDAMAPITANTPLPPLTPLPLASQPDDDADPPPPAAGGWTDPDEQTVLPPLPAYLPAPPLAKAEAPQPATRSAGGSGVSATWAAYTMFVLLFTSLILIVVMAVAAAVISKNVTVLIVVIILTFVVNLVYAGIVFSIARPGAGEPLRLPFLNRRRGA